MLKRILAARKHVAIGLAVGLTALATGAFADAATGRIRHMADTYQCVSHYELFGYGVSEVAQVENLPSATVMVVR